MGSNKLGLLSKIENKKIKLNENKTYYRVAVLKDGKRVVLLLTEDQIGVAIERAAKNEEDLGKVGFFRWLFGG